MDFFLCLLIAWYFVKNGSEDLVHAVRGTESPRSKRKMYRLKTGQPSPAGQLGEAISTYLADWIHDASTDARAKRQEIRERRAAKKAEKETAAGKAAGAGEDAVAGNTRTPDDRNEPEPTAAREAVRDDTPDGADAGEPEGASTGSAPNEQPPPAADAASGPNGFGLGYVAGRAEERERQRWRDEAGQTPPRRPEPVQAWAERLDSAGPSSAAEPPAPPSAQDVMDVELVDERATLNSSEVTGQAAAEAAHNASQQDGQQVSNAPEAKQDNGQTRPGAWLSDQATEARSNLTLDEQALVPIPVDEIGACPQCGNSYELVPGTVAGDEGDGSAMVDTACPRCRIQSCHFWQMPDTAYDAIFGHPFGVDDEPPEGDDPGAESQDPTEPRDQQPLATVTPINTISGGSSLSTPTPTTIRTNGGETVDPQSAMTFADAVGAVGSGLVGEMETSIANLVARGVSGEPIAHLQHMLEAAQQLEGNSATARRYFENHAQIQEVAQSDATVGGGTYLGIGQ